MLQCDAHPSVGYAHGFQLKMIKQETIHNKPQCNQMEKNAAENRQYSPYSLNIAAAAAAAAVATLYKCMCAKKNIGRKVKDRHNGYAITFAAASITRALVRHSYIFTAHRYKIILHSVQGNFISLHIMFLS